MGILFAHARDESNILCSAPFVGFNALRRVGDLRCEKDLVKRDERL